MTKVQPSGYNPDVAYGTTPEQALYAVIEQQPAFNTRDPQYIGERPEFMDVKTHDFDLHDWGQYERNRSHVPGTKSDPPYVSTRDAIDIVPENNEVRKRFTIENVWINVGYGDWDDDRAEVKFKFSIQMRQSAWDGVDEPRPGDLQWYCERISTEPVR